MHIVITGASGGIGRDITLRLHALPATRVVAIARNAERLEALAAEAGDGRLWPCPLNVAGPLEGVCQAVASHLDGRVDVLINNAGALLHKPFSELAPSDWAQMLDVNLLAPARLVQALLPCMGAGSHIVNIGSMGGFQGSTKFPGLAAYSASKAALANLSECLAEELKPQGIAVNCLALGAVQTEMLEQAFPGYQAPIDSAGMADFIADFALQGHRFFNGKILPVSIATP